MSFKFKLLAVTGFGKDTLIDFGINCWTHNFGAGLSSIIGTISRFCDIGKGSVSVCFGASKSSEVGIDFEMVVLESSNDIGFGLKPSVSSNESVFSFLVPSKENNLFVLAFASSSLNKPKEGLDFGCTRSLTTLNLLP